MAENRETSKTERFKVLIASLKADLDEIKSRDIQAHLKNVYETLKTMEEHHLQERNMGESYFYDDYNGLIVDVYSNRVGLENNFGLRISKHKNLRKEAQDELSRVRCDEPEGLFNFKAKREWSRQLNEAMEKVYKPGVSETFQEVYNTVKENTKHNTRMCAITNKTVESGFDDNKHEYKKRAEDVYKFINGERVDESDPNYIYI